MKLSICKIVLFISFIGILTLFSLFLWAYPEKNIWLLLTGGFFLFASMLFVFLTFYTMAKHEADQTRAEIEHRFKLALEDRQDARHIADLERRTMVDEYEKVNTILKTLVELYKTDIKNSKEFTEKDVVKLKEHLKAPVELISEIKKLLK